MSAVAVGAVYGSSVMNVVPWPGALSNRIDPP
jgi:hypothetical protein